MDQFNSISSFREENTHNQKAKEEIDGDGNQDITKDIRKVNRRTKEFHHHHRRSSNLIEKGEHDSNQNSQNTIDQLQLIEQGIKSDRKYENDRNEQMQMQINLDSPKVVINQKRMEGLFKSEKRPSIQQKQWIDSKT